MRQQHGISRNKQYVSTFIMFIAIERFADSSGLSGPGPTPDWFVEVDPDYNVNDAQILHGIYVSLIGEAIGFTSQRNGRIYNNLIPFRGLESVANSSSGSSLDFGFHVEDAFHPARADYLGLVCMRNEERAATTVSCVEGVILTEEEKEALYSPRFRISHNPIHPTNAVIDEHCQSVLFGHLDRPYVRINAASMNIEEYEGIERQALEKPLPHFANNLVALVLQTGDCVFVDNYRCVHARDAFKAKFGEHAR